MRDRRLIIPAVALLIAIVAVPFVLSSTSESVVSVPSPAADPQAVAVEPAVLAVQEVGVRDYRKRLDNLSKKDPFGSRFEPKVPKEKDLDDASDVGAGGTSGTGATPNPTGSTPTGSTPSTTTTPPEPFVIVSRVDVVTKIVGRKQDVKHENVHSGDILPSKKAPVVLFLRNVDAGNLAEFIVSRDVSKVNGDGNCKPGKTNCEFLTLADGETAYLRYADGNRYSLRVTDIRFEHIPESEFDQSD